VFVTSGEVQYVNGTVTQGGKFTSKDVHPIDVGLAILDTRAPTSGKMIVVGGPCANVVAARLMGNPQDCAAGFTPGHAMIKLFADQNAILVAGYSASDTVGASYVLANYKKYGLSGTQVDIVTADLSSLSVSRVE